MTVSKHIPGNIKRVSRSVGFALWLNEWEGLHVILRARLSERQRAALAFMALKSLNYETACLTANAALPQANEQGEAV